MVLILIVLIIIVLLLGYYLHKKFTGKGDNNSIKGNLYYVENSYILIGESNFDCFKTVDGYDYKYVCPSNYKKIMTGFGIDEYSEKFNGKYFKLYDMIYNNVKFIILRGKEGESYMNLFKKILPIVSYTEANNYKLSDKTSIISNKNKYKTSIIITEDNNFFINDIYATIDSYEVLWFEYDKTGLIGLYKDMFQKSKHDNDNVLTNMVKSNHFENLASKDGPIYKKLCDYLKKNTSAVYEKFIELLKKKETYQKGMLLYYIIYIFKMIEHGELEEDVEDDGKSYFLFKVKNKEPLIEFMKSLLNPNFQIVDLPFVQKSNNKSFENVEGFNCFSNKIILYENYMLLNVHIQEDLYMIKKYEKEIILPDKILESLSNDERLFNDWDENINKGETVEDIYNNEKINISQYISDIFKLNTRANPINLYYEFSVEKLTDWSDNKYESAKMTFSKNMNICRFDYVLKFHDINSIVENFLKENLYKVVLGGLKDIMDKKEESEYFVDYYILENYLCREMGIDPKDTDFGSKLNRMRNENQGITKKDIAKFFLSIRLPGDKDKNDDDNFESMLYYKLEENQNIKKIIANNFDKFTTEKKKKYKTAYNDNSGGTFPWTYLHINLYLFASMYVLPENHFSIFIVNSYNHNIFFNVMKEFFNCENDYIEGLDITPENYKKLLMIN